MLSFAVAGVAPAGCMIALAGDGSNRWLRIARDSSYDIAIDTTRITRRYGQVYVAWYRTDYAATHLYKGKPFDRETVQAMLRCDDLSFKVVSVDVSLGADRPIGQQRADRGELGKQRWRYVERGTIEGVAARATCDFARRHATSRR